MGKVANVGIRFKAFYESNVKAALDKDITYIDSSWKKVNAAQIVAANQQVAAVEKVSKAKKKASDDAVAQAKTEADAADKKYRREQDNLQKLLDKQIAADKKKADSQEKELQRKSDNAKKQLDNEAALREKAANERAKQHEKELAAEQKAAEKLANDLIKQQERVEAAKQKAAEKTQALAAKQQAAVQSKIDRNRDVIAAGQSQRVDYSPKTSGSTESYVKAIVDRRNDLHKLAFKQLEHLYDENGRHLLALEQRIQDEKNEVVRAGLQKELTIVKRDQRQISAEYRSRPEVAHHGAGAERGIMGVGRHVIGNYGGEIGAVISDSGLQGLASGAGVVAGIAVVGELGKKLHEAGNEADRLKLESRAAFETAGQSGEKLNQSVERQEKFIDIWANKLAVPIEKFHQASNEAAFLGGATGRANEEITKMAVAVEKQTNGLVSTESVVRALTKGLSDPAGQEALGKLTNKFPALATAVAGAKNQTEFFQKAIKFLKPTLDEAEQSAGTLAGKEQIAANELHSAWLKAGTEFNKFVSGVVDGVGSAVPKFLELIGVITPTELAQKELTSATSEYLKRLDESKKIKQHSDYVRELADRYDKTKKEGGDLTKITGELDAATGSVASAMNDYGTVIDIDTGKVRSLANAQQNLSDKMAETSRLVMGGKAHELVQQMHNSAKDLQNAQQDYIIDANMSTQAKDIIFQRDWVAGANYTKDQIAKMRERFDLYWDKKVNEQGGKIGELAKIQQDADAAVIAAGTAIISHNTLYTQEQLRKEFRLTADESVRIWAEIQRSMKQEDAPIDGLPAVRPKKETKTADQKLKESYERQKDIIEGGLANQLASIERFDLWMGKSSDEIEKDKREKQIETYNILSGLAANYIKKLHEGTNEYAAVVKDQGDLAQKAADIESAINKKKVEDEQKSAKEIYDSITKSWESLLELSKKTADGEQTISKIRTQIAEDHIKFSKSKGDVEKQIALENFQYRIALDEEEAQHQKELAEAQLALSKAKSLPDTVINPETKLPEIDQNLAAIKVAAVNEANNQIDQANQAHNLREEHLSNEHVDRVTNYQKSKYGEVTSLLENAFASAFGTIDLQIVKTDTFFGALVNNFIQGIAQMAEQLAAKAAIFGILNLITGGGFGAVWGGIGNFLFPGASKAAAGDIVPGYGGGDRHPYLLEGGEGVLTKEVVGNLGKPLVNYWNANPSAVRKMATGGIAGTYTFPPGPGNWARSRAGLSDDYTFPPGPGNWNRSRAGMMGGTDYTFPPGPGNWARSRAGMPDDYTFPPGPSDAIARGGTDYTFPPGPGNWARANSYGDVRSRLQSYGNAAAYSGGSQANFSDKKIVSAISELRKTVANLSLEVSTDKLRMAQSGSRGQQLRIDKIK